MNATKGIKGFVSVPLSQRMSEMTEKTDGCWFWRGAGDGRYGTVWVSRRSKKAHVVAWELANKCEKPKGKVVMHSCDNTKCVNPEHLVLGTQSENIRDASKKGRLPHRTWSDLCSVMAAAAKASGQFTQFQIAEQLGLTRDVVQKHWNELPAALSLDAGEAYRQEHEWLRTKYREHQARADALGGELKRTQAAGKAVLEELAKTRQIFGDYDYTPTSFEECQYVWNQVRNGQIQAEKERDELKAQLELERLKPKSVNVDKALYEENSQLQAQVAALHNAANKFARDVTLTNEHHNHAALCTLNKTLASTADAAKAYEARIRAEERERMVKGS